MRSGDISNEPASAVGMRFERVIKTEEGKLNRSAKAHLQYLGRLNINRYVITTGDSRKAIAFLYKWDVPYFRVISADSTLEIPEIVREHDMLAYYDADREIVNNVNSRGHGKVDAKLWTSVEVS